MNATTLAALAAFPAQLEAHYAAIPAEYRRWNPPSWDGIPSEHFNALGQVCHVRDIEIDGYHARLRRTLAEAHPVLASIDSEALAVERNYSYDDADAALAAFRAARAATLALLADVAPHQWQRTAEFEGYGVVTLQGLVHYLCSHDQQHLAGMQWLLGKIDAARLQRAD
jgi:DinB superfamily